MKKIKLPIITLLKLVAQPELLKCYCIYGKLKLIYSNSAVHQWNTVAKKEHIAKTLGISINTLKKFIGIMKEKGIVKVIDGILRLGRKTIWNEILRATTKNKNFKIIELEIKDLNLDDLKFLALEAKRNQIEWKQKDRIGNVLLKSYGTIYDESIKKKIKKNLKTKTEGIYEKLSTDVSYNFLNKRKKYGFLDSNMCGLSIAKLFGRKTGITGNRFIRKMWEQKRIDVQPRRIELAELTVDVQNLNQDKIFLSRGFICRNIPLQWSSKEHRIV